MNDTDFPGFWGWAAREPQRLAVVEAAGRITRFGDLAAASHQVARAARNHGLAVEDNIAVLLPNCTEVFEVFFACMQAGFYFTPINHFLAVPEIAYVLENSEARILVAHERHRAIVDLAMALANFPPEHCFWIGEDAAGSYESWKSAQSPAPIEDRRAGQIMQYSSGTTGRPKGIRYPLPDADPDSREAARSAAFEVNGVRVGAGMHLVNGPLHHSAPITYSTICLHLGHGVVLMDKWDAELALQMIERHRVTTTQMVPTMFNRLLKLSPETRAQYDTSSLTLLVHAAAPCPIPVKRQMIEWLGPIIHESYGGSEGGGTTCSSQEWLAHPGTVGRPWGPIKLKILDDDGNEVPPRQPGNVYLKTQFGTPEYFKDSEKSRAARIGDFCTLGDIGYVDEDGWLFLVDRKSDIIISGGVNIYPAEIEQVLLQHPAVQDAAVIGIPNEEWGEEVKALVQLSPNVTATNVVDELRQLCTANLARYKVPRSIELVESLPRSDNGKIYKRQLRDAYWAGRERRI